MLNASAFKLYFKGIELFYQQDTPALCSDLIHFFLSLHGLMHRHRLQVSGLDFQTRYKHTFLQKVVVRVAKMLAIGSRYYRDQIRKYFLVWGIFFRYLTLYLLAKCRPPNALGKSSKLFTSLRHFYQALAALDERIWSHQSHH